MDKVEALALQVAKEIVVKFVETGRISPANFSEHFGQIYGTVLRVINNPDADTAETSDSSNS